eukprot:8894202-Heterocapsa_arctica.AAC.1
MRKAIDGGKVRKGARCRLSRRPNVVVAIKIRDKVLLMQNKSGLVLCSRPTEEEDTLRWFLEELKKDLMRLPDATSRAQEEGQEVEDMPRKRGGGHRVPIDDDDPEQSIIQASLSRIRDHPQCHHVTYLPSRNCFKVIKKNDSNDKYVYLKGIAKKRKEALERQDDRSEEAFRQLFEQAISACIDFLQLT